MYVWSSSKRLANERRRGPESNGEKGDASSLRTSSDRKRAEVTRSALWVESQNRSPLGRATNFPNKAGAGVGEGGGRGGARREGGHTKKSAFIPRPPTPREAQPPTPYQITSSPHDLLDHAPQPRLHAPPHLRAAFPSTPERDCGSCGRRSSQLSRTGEGGSLGRPTANVESSQMQQWNANVGCLSGADADADAPKPDIWRRSVRLEGSACVRLLGMSGLGGSADDVPCAM